MDSIADVVESADNDGAAVGVAHEHDSIEVFEQDLVHDIVDVSAQTHVGVNEVDPFADAGEAWSEHLVTLGRQQSAD